ncbi:50S ribosomal protein L17 [compost metagenome]
MRHRKAKNRLSKPADQRRALLRSLTTELFRHGQITTTEARAKALRVSADSMVTLAKRGDLHARRQAESFILDGDVTKRLFTELAPQFKERNGGYTQIIKTAPRGGDNAPMAIVRLVEA